LLSARYSGGSHNTEKLRNSLEKVNKERSKTVRAEKLLIMYTEEKPAMCAASSNATRRESVAKESIDKTHLETFIEK
jgi:hypothetical protein